MLFSVSHFPWSYAQTAWISTGRLELLPLRETKGFMRARIGVKPRSNNITSGCLVSLSPSATLHHAMAFHIVLSINTSCKSSGSGSAAWFQEGNRKLGSLWKIWSNQHHSTEHLTKRWLQSRSAKCQVVPSKTQKTQTTPALQDIARQRWMVELVELVECLVLRAWPMQKIPLAPGAIF